MRHIGKLGAFGAFAGFGVAIACAGGGVDDQSSFTEDGTDANISVNAGCPATFPPVGAECTLPEGTACITGACGDDIRICSQGVWKSNQVVKSGTCPESPPSAGTECSRCFPATMTCDYDVDCEDGGTPLRALCVGAVWQVTELTCSDGGAESDAAPVDGASDADGSADAN